MADLAEIQKTLAVCTIANMTSAMDLSATFAEHAGKPEVTPNEIALGLIYRLMTPLDTAESRQLMAGATEIYEESLAAQDGEEHDDDDDDDETALAAEPRETTTTVRAPNCNCARCIQMRVCLINFQSYEPADAFAASFLSAINKTAQTHNLVLPGA